VLTLFKVGLIPATRESGVTEVAMATDGATIRAGMNVHAANDYYMRLAQGRRTEDCGKDEG
jgi:hypothetical protein